MNQSRPMHFPCGVNYLHITINLQQGAGRLHFYISQSTFHGLFCHTAVSLIGIFFNHIVAIILMGQNKQSNTYNIIITKSTKQTCYYAILSQRLLQSKHFVTVLKYIY